MGKLEGKVALVTGSGRRGGIGRSIILALAEEGAAVAVNDWNRDDDSLEFMAELDRKGARALFVPGDVTDIHFCDKMVDTVVRELGAIDILVNNAGFANMQNIEDITEEDWDHSMRLHLKAPFFLARAAARQMRAKGFGRIVNISSEQAYIGHDQLPHYTAAKAGLRTLSKSLALAFGPEITVNSVCPGPTATDKFKSGPEYAAGLPPTLPLKRWGKPEDVAQSVLFLVGPGGDAYTGQTLDPNVGAVMD